MKLRPLAQAILTLGLLFPWSNSAFAVDDPSIKGELRARIQEAILHAIDQGTVGGVYHLHDPLTGNVLNLEFMKLHRDIVKESDLYVRCAAIKDKRGRVVDVDFLVIPDADEMRVTLAVVHKIGVETKGADTLMPILVLWAMVYPHQWAAVSWYTEAILCQWRAEKLRDNGFMAVCMPRTVRQPASKMRRPENKRVPLKSGLRSG